MANQKSNESAPKDTSPSISAATPTGDDIHTRRYDLVEEMQFLFVRVVKAKELRMDARDTYVEIKLGNLRATTFIFWDRALFPEWNQVYAFEKDKIQDLSVQVSVKGNVQAEEDEGQMRTTPLILGSVTLLLGDVPRRVPPESALAPQWYKLEVDGQDQSLLPISGNVMLALWMGTQADECFPHAWCSDAIKLSADSADFARSKVYMSPTLWYLRVNVVQAQDLLPLFVDPSSNSSNSIFVQVDLGAVRLRTSFSKNKQGTSPSWNEDLMFVAQEPFNNDSLALSVEQGTLTQHVSLGKCGVRLKDVERRLDGAPVDGKWYDLISGRPAGIINEAAAAAAENVKFASKLCARISLDGAYHVADESEEYCSDFRPSARKLWKPCIGVLELGILKGTDFVPMKAGAGGTDAYCVAKYGPKWVRTRTVVDSLSPTWNEQYVWEVYEPYTFITVAVFDNNQLDAGSRGAGAKDAMMGKCRIRVSKLSRGRVYAHSYPLMRLHPSGMKRMGELHLALRLSCPFWSSLGAYMTPLFPRHHHLFPLSPAQSDNLRTQAVSAVAQRLSMARPPLTKEVVYGVVDVRSDFWSMRKARANLNRAVSLVGGFVFLWKWLDRICSWKDPFATLLVHFLCILMLLFPESILPFVILSLFGVGLRHYKAAAHPCSIDAKLSGVDAATAQDLEEELDMLPTQLGGVTLRSRYDRLRIIGRSVETMVSDLATMVERIQDLSSWRDPRATQMFLLFCAVGFLAAVTIPAKVLIFFGIVYFLRHPRFRSPLPPIPLTFLRRMPSKQASML